MKSARKSASFHAFMGSLPLSGDELWSK